jgi:RNA polymerase sigma-70 factor (ECF subfamily)
MNRGVEDWAANSTALAELLARIALGDRDAFSTLYRQTSARLLGVILRINSDRALAEDVLQDVYVNVWRAARSFDSLRSQPMTWLTSVARNRAIDSLRRKRTEPRLQSTTEYRGDDDEEHDMLNHIPSDAPGPLHLLLQAAQARALGDCVTRLSADQQQCLALAYYQGLSHAEVADHLVQPLGTIKSWVRRALQNLKGCLSRAAGLPGSTALDID